MKISSVEHEVIKFTVACTRQELKDLKEILGCNVSVPQALAPDSIVRHRLMTLMDEFRKGIELL